MSLEKSGLRSQRLRMTGALANSMEDGRILFTDEVTENHSAGVVNYIFSWEVTPRQTQLEVTSESQDGSLELLLLDTREGKTEVEYESTSDTPFKEGTLADYFRRRLWDISKSERYRVFAPVLHKLLYSDDIRWEE